MLKKQMTRWGIGPQFTIMSGIYAVIVGVIHFTLVSHLTIPLPRILTLILGIIFVVIGIPIFLIPGFTIDKYFVKGKLATGNVYAYIRHPIYGSWIVFIIPGVVFIINSLIGLTIPVFMYLVFRVLIVEEERYLEEKFGKEYEEYKRRVGSIFPKLRTIFKSKKGK